jgi:hypothetical protein
MELRRLLAALLFVLGACDEAVTPRGADAGRDARVADSAPPGDDGPLSGDPDAPGATPDAAPPPPLPGNTVDKIIDDMLLMNDVDWLPGAQGQTQWATGPGNVIMGGDPRGSTTPTWWQPANQSYKSSAYWTHLVGWFVAWDGPGHSAPNTRVQLADFKVYLLLKSTNSWSLASETSGVGGENFSKNLIDAASGADLRDEPDGSSSLRLTSPYAFHGWSKGEGFDGADVKGAFATFRARLILDDPSGPDDRGTARVLVQCGLDYYPNSQSKAGDFYPDSYLPGSGGSRFKWVTSTWQPFSYASVNAGPSTLDPSTPVTPERALSEAEFRANPPPL